MTSQLVPCSWNNCPVYLSIVTPRSIIGFGKKKQKDKKREENERECINDFYWLLQTVELCWCCISFNSPNPQWILVMFY